MVERRRGYLQVAPWVLEVLGAPEVHLVQGGLVAPVGLGCQPGLVHPVPGSRKPVLERDCPEL